MKCNRKNDSTICKKKKKNIQELGTVMDAKLSASCDPGGGQLRSGYH